VSSPEKEYQHRLAERRAQHAALDRRERTISNGRLVVFMAGVILVIIVLTTDHVNPLWLLAPLVVFIAVAVLHDVVIRRKDLASAAVGYYERALARLEGRWAGTGIQRTQGFVSENHPYVADLDLFGEASLFELLCTARTRAGEQTLARWLLHPAPVKEVRERQQAVEDLRSRLDLREDLALLGGGLRAEVDPDALARWGEEPAAFPGPWHGAARTAGVVLALAAVAAGALWAAGVAGPIPLLAVAALEWVVYRAVGKRLRAVVAAVERAGRELRVLAGVVARLEPERFSAARLQALHARLSVEGRPVSAAVRGLDRLVNWLDAQRNALFAPVGFLLMWPLNFGMAIESWRLTAGKRIRGWLEVVGELEALTSLASYAYEHPDDPFPELEDQGPLLRAEGLGHPLIQDSVCVRNNVTLGPSDRAWIVSGSNMSGKTTLLRTVGVNVVLALAGAPIRANAMTLSPLAVGATIRIHDSLQAKRSRFYAEIQRLKQLMDIATGGQAPLLFLLDEILHGTNSRDRQIGAAALLRQLLSLGAVGLVTTHDLAIADASDELIGRTANKHFRDHLEQGQLAFDYTLREGVVQGSNAIALMRAVGLDIPEPAGGTPEQKTPAQREDGLKKISSSSSGTT
jgi:hypothetical protein